jgi:cell division transport system permease protein
MGTVAVAFVTLGGFLLAASNLQRIVSQWGSAAEMSVFLRDDMDEAARRDLAGELAKHASVERAAYVSKDQALTRFKSDFPELAEMTAAEGNPFPPSIDVQLRTEAVGSGAADRLADDLRARAGVLDVRYDREWMERLLVLIDGIRWIGLAITGVLVLGAAFTVAAVVRLSLFARRDEIEIMRLVGAPFAYIRGPSVAEGTILGGLGALTSLVALYVLYRTFKLQISEALLALSSAGEFQFLGGAEAAAMVAAALVLGGLTGIMVARSIR